MKFNFLLLLFLIFFFSCTSPKNTAQQFLEALNSHQFETAMNLVTKDSEPILYELINMQQEQIPDVKIEVKQCASVDENDDHVLCLYGINANGEYFEKKMHLIKENNDWKVDLTQEIQ